MKATTTSNLKSPSLFPADVQAEYDRFVLERRKQDAARAKRFSKVKATGRGPDRSGY